jgi:HK97 family phage major capsid protein
MSNVQTPFSTLQRRTADEVAAIRRHTSKIERHLDLRDFILSKTQFPSRTLDEKVLSAFQEMSESCRQRSGQIPLGNWMPLSVLSRDLNVTSGAGMVTGKLSPNPTNSLLPHSAVVNGGAMVISGLSGQSYGLSVVDPNLDVSNGWIPEGASAPADEPQFENSLLQPHRLTVSVTISRKLLHNASVDVDALVRRELVSRFSYAIDAAAVNGTGSDQPLGILRHPDLDIISAGTNGAAPAYQHLLELEHNVLSRSGGDGLSPTYVMSPKLTKKLRGTPRVSGGDRFIMEGKDLLGYQVRTAPNMPDNLIKGTSGEACSALLFGDLSEVVIGFWGPAAVDFIVDDYTLRKDNKIRIVAHADVGIQARRIGAFSAYKDLLAS